MKVYPILLLLFSANALAEPWLDTRDVWLRADIEQLASEGIIKAPITTWPLPWASIIKDLEAASEEDMDPDMVPAFLRLKRKAGIEMGSNGQTSISLRAGNQNKVLRQFGDEDAKKQNFLSELQDLVKHWPGILRQQKLLTRLMVKKIG